MNDYEKVAEAITFIRKNFRRQPDLEEVAGHVNLSPYHFQRLFTRWAGVSPKKFLKYVSIEHAKSMLRARASLLETSFETGLSGSGRLHDLFINIEGMTPGDFKNGGAALAINYDYRATPFGEVLVGTTSRGVCHLSFADDERNRGGAIRAAFPNADLRRRRDSLQDAAVRIFTEDWSNVAEIRLHLRGTPFQIKVWDALLRIPSGQVVTYGAVAEAMGRAGAHRSVAHAVAANPVAYLIPCHRVIRASGDAGEYHWGSERKLAMIGWESAHREREAGAAPAASLHASRVG